MKKTISLYFIISYIAWIILSFNFGIENLILGFVASFITALIFGNMFTYIPVHIKPASIYWIVLYAGIVLLDLIRSVILSGYKVLIVTNDQQAAHDITVKTSISSPLGVTLLANAISLSPLMLTTDYERETGLLHVHSTAENPEEAAERLALLVLKYETIIKKFLSQK